MALRQDRVLGALLGMGIGDALGMPVEGWTRERVAERFGGIDGYHPRTFDDGAELAAGEFTDDSEGVLCIVESFTASSGELDPANILARLVILARGEAHRWMNPSTREGIELADSGRPSFNRVTGDVAARGIPLGLIAAARPLESTASIQHWSTALAEMTHADSLAAASIHFVAEAIRVMASGERTPAELISSLALRDIDDQFTHHLDAVILGIDSGTNYDELAATIGLGDDVLHVVTTAITAAALATDFEAGVYAAASLGGAADSRAAITGALLGAHHGTAGISQSLIDGLEGRMYVMLAAPWFYQTIQLKNSFWRSGS